MKADAITGQILEDARQGASQTLRDAEKRVEEMRKANDIAQSEQEKAAMKGAKADCAELRDRMLRMAELDQRKELLSMKRELIDAVFNAALGQMRKMPAKKARAFIGDMLVEAARGDEAVIVSTGDEGTFDKSFVDEMNTRLAKAKKTASLTLSNEKREMGGGVILSHEGMEINLTYPSILSEKRTQLEAEVAGMLFGDR